MPAYGKQLSPPEVTALVAWLETLRPGYEPVARDESHKLRRGEERPRHTRRQTHSIPIASALPRSENPLDCAECGADVPRRQRGSFRL
jgi:hypothetical protein